ncbi:MAG: glutathione transport system substrate-binding protein [Pseudonocardiales bacterium]|nr:glutathione transport system substrate-binding protein [Pseudonocardiales bacterium]
MKVRSWSGSWVAALLCVLTTGLTVTLAGCSSSGGGPAPTPAATGANDINPRPADQLRDGGDLRWPIDSLPDNFNRNQFSGSQVQTKQITDAMLPVLYTDTADGGTARNADFLTAADLTSAAPQVVTYALNPKATWSDGKPITWRDFEAQWKALNATNPAYLISSRTGYEDIASVAPGTDDHHVVVTFARTFAEWESLFSPLYPASTNADPTLFNTGWINKIPVTAGPFALDAIDPTAKTVTLRRDPKWWGRPAKLDRIIFKVFERTATADALANNEIDFYPIGSSVDLLKRAQSVPGAAIRQSAERLYNQITFNGAPGAILSDLKLRQAIAKGIDRTAIARRMVGAIVPNVTQLGNHIYAYGSKDYRDNSGVLPYDRGAANRELDTLGWVRASPDAMRSRNGQPLRLRLLEGTPNPIGQQIDRTVLDQLAQLGVTVTIQPVPIQQASSQYKTGNFDLVAFAWQNTSTPFSGSQGLYAEPRGDDVQQNYGRIYDPQVSALFEQGLRELNDTRRADLGNQADRLIWQEVHHLPLYPATGAYAVRSTLANFGAPGFADIDYIDAGYLK